jgi:ribosomal protein L35AE/L33A
MDCSRAVTRTTIWNGLVEPFMNRSHGQVVVQELSKLHGHEGVTRVEVANVGMD